MKVILAMSFILSSAAYAAESSVFPANPKYPQPSYYENGRPVYVGPRAKKKCSRKLVYDKKTRKCVVKQKAD